MELDFLYLDVELEIFPFLKQDILIPQYDQFIWGSFLICLFIHLLYGTFGYPFKDIDPLLVINDLESIEIVDIGLFFLRGQLLQIQMGISAIPDLEGLEVDI